MLYRKLGNTGLLVSEIGLGCEGFVGKDEIETIKLFDFAFDKGINYLDLYASNPTVRSNIGVAIKNRREKLIIQAHLCTVWKKEQYERTRNISEIKEGFKDLLIRLQTDYIDVGMIHYVDSIDDWDDIMNGEIMNYLLELKTKGLIRHIGMSSHNPLVALKAAQSGLVEVIMFSINPCYDLQPADDDCNKLFDPANYQGKELTFDEDRKNFYETSQRLGVAITVMKVFGGGDLLDDKLSPIGIKLSTHQCINYVLGRPAVACALVGAKSIEELQACIDYETSTSAEKDYSIVFANCKQINGQGHCMYCGHCAPCPKGIDVATVTKFLNLAKVQKIVPETVREHYKELKHKASECINCGACEARCPFGVKIRNNMQEAKNIFEN